MLTKEEIQVLIVHRLIAACDSCNSHHINRVEGQIEGLVAALNDGKICRSGGDVRTILKAADIPYEDTEDGGWDVGEEWMIERGCDVSGSSIKHPRSNNNRGQ